MIAMCGHPPPIKCSNYKFQGHTILDVVQLLGLDEIHIKKASRDFWITFITLLKSLLPLFNFPTRFPWLECNLDEILNSPHGTKQYRLVWIACEWDRIRKQPGRMHNHGMPSPSSNKTPRIMLVPGTYSRWRFSGGHLHVTKVSSATEESKQGIHCYSNDEASVPGSGCCAMCNVSYVSDDLCLTYATYA